ncbi:hypothetical protein QN277_019443 [Acacia crassicarpa]|uniref:Uncharacterized protein n=1 Tax=Acacia crassicarpa TaxID=499986 RepID=A0AAE1KDE2_9FABA|nr:hypothetical protein QN277_019443 [Acacia crassicarpa]
MAILHLSAPLQTGQATTCSKSFFHNINFVPSSFVALTVPSYTRYTRLSCDVRNPRKKLNSKDIDIDIFDEEQESKVEDVGEFSTQGLYASRQTVDIDLEDEQEDDDDYAAGFSGQGANAGKQEKDYDRDPEFAEILGSCLDDPNKARSKMEERFRKKRSKILHTKTGSGVPMKVSFNKFDFSNSYIWIEFYNTPLAKDISLLCDTIRAWHIVGRLGGCNSMNMQLSQSPLEKRPSYDYIQGSNVTPSTFYNIGDLEVQDNLARIWVDIGTNEPLLLDVLINALTQISSDFVGIKQVMFGGAEFENWKENLTSEEAGYSIHKI